MLWEPLLVEKEVADDDPQGSNKVVVGSRENHTAVSIGVLPFCGRPPSSFLSELEDDVLVVCGGYCEVSEAGDIFGLRYHRHQHGDGGLLGTSNKISIPSTNDPPYRFSLSLLGSDRSVERDSAVMVNIPVNIVASAAEQSNHKANGTDGDSNLIEEEVSADAQPPSPQKMAGLSYAALFIGGMDSDSMDLLGDIRTMHLTSYEDNASMCAATGELHVLNQQSGCLELFNGVPSEFRRRWRHCGASSSIPSQYNISGPTGFEVLLFGGELEEENGGTKGDNGHDDVDDTARVGNAINELWRLSGVAWWGAIPQNDQDHHPQLYFTSLTMTRIFAGDATQLFPSPRYLSSLVSLGVVSESSTQHGHQVEHPTTVSTMYALYGGAQDRPDEFPDNPVISLNDAYLLTVTTTSSALSSTASVSSCTWSKMDFPRTSSPPKVNGHVGFRLCPAATMPFSATAVFYGGKENATGNDDFHVFSLVPGEGVDNSVSHPSLQYTRLPCPFEQSSYATPLEEDGGRVLTDSTNPWPHWRYCAAVCQQGDSISLVGGNCRHADVTTIYRLRVKGD